VADNLFIPADPLSIPFRPLNKGMVTTLSTLGLPDGSLFDIQNAQMNMNGPRSVGDWNTFLDGITYLWADEIPLRIEHLTLSSGSVVSVLVTNRTLYELEYTPTTTTLTPVYMSNTPIVSSVVSATVNFPANSNLVGYDIRAGDLMMVDIAGTLTYFEIDSVTDADTLVLLDAPGAISTKMVYFVKKFLPESGTMVSSATMTRSGLAFSLYVDGPLGGIWKFDGELSKHTLVNESDVERVTKARSVAVFRDMFYFGGVTDGAPFLPFRIVWTSVLDTNEITSTSYIDMPAQLGDITRMMPFGAQILSIHQSGLGLGRQTNLTGLPYMFSQLDTGGVAPIDPESCTVFMENFVFVSRDNIYLIDQNSGFRAIGDQISPTVRELCARSNPESLGVLALADLSREQLLFCFPSAGAYSRVISYNYRSNAFSYFMLTSSEMLTVSTIGDVTTIDELTGSLDTLTQSFYTMVGFKKTMQLIRLSSRNLATYDEFADTYRPIIIESGDIDFNEPDSDKSLLRVGLKVNDNIGRLPRSVSLKFFTEVSIDRAKSWITVGELFIDIDKTEDTATCRIFGSHFRMRFTQVLDSETGPVSPPIEINEIILRVRKRSIEAVAAG